jgi:hypothetical protein
MPGVMRSGLTFLRRIIMSDITNKDYEEAAKALSTIAYLIEQKKDPAHEFMSLDLRMNQSKIVKTDLDRDYNFVRIPVSPDDFPMIYAVSLLGIVASDRDYLMEYGEILRNLPKIPNVSFMEKPPARPAYWREKTVEWGKTFLAQFVHEFRNLVCAKGGTYGKIRSQYKGIPQAVAAAASTAVISSLGVTEPMALGVATLAVLSVGSVTKNAFCKSTEEEILKAIDDKLSKRRSRKK